jgi:hypothetical protein
MSNNLTKLLIAGAAIAGGVVAYKHFSGKTDPSTFSDHDTVKLHLAETLQAAYRENEDDVAILKRAFLAGAKFAQENPKAICAAIDAGYLEDNEASTVEAWLEGLGEEALQMGYQPEALETALQQAIAYGLLTKYPGQENCAE